MAKKELSDDFKSMFLEQETRDSRLESQNRSIYFLAGIFSCLFLGMVIFLLIFYMRQGDEIQNNPYNLRIRNLSKDVIRGNIVTSDGVVIAESFLEDGKEVRSYPQKNTYAHIGGYLPMGSSGAEKLCSYYLLSSHSGLEAKWKNEWFGVKMQGDTAVLSIDSDLQKLSYELLGDQKGAVVAVEPSTGRILALVSKPDFDPNSLEELMSETAKKEEGEKESFLVNRVTNGMYPPGSTFKILTSLAYLRSHPDYRDEVIFHCDGEYETSEGVIHCAGGAVHGDLRLSGGFGLSCNGIYADISKDIPVSMMRKTASDFGFNELLTDAFPVSVSSFPLENGAGEFEKMQTAFGQGRTLVTPLQEAMIAATIANHGIMKKPIYLDKILSPEGKEVETFSSEDAKLCIGPSEADYLTEMMKGCIYEGTGKEAQVEGITVAGKTGSAQYGEGADTHAIFVGFAPAEDPKIALCVYVEQGGSGGKIAAPIASKLFEEYLKN